MCSLRRRLSHVADMRHCNKMSQSYLGPLLVLVAVAHLYSAVSCPVGQVEHRIESTYDLRCCYSLMVEIDNEFVMCSVNGSSDTQKPCAPGLYQPDRASSEYEPHCISDMEALNCNSFDTKIVQDGASKKCICNLDAGFCGLDQLHCKEIRSINCAGNKVDQNCGCILTSPLQPVTHNRTEEAKATNLVVNITLSQLPKEETPSWTDGKTTEDPNSRGDHDMKNTVNNDVSSNSIYNLAIAVSVPCLLGMLGLLFCWIHRQKRSAKRHSTVYSPLCKGDRKDIAAGIGDEEISTQRLRHGDSIGPVQYASTIYIENEYKDHRTSGHEGTAIEPLIEVVPSDPALVYSLEEIPRPGLCSTLYSSLSTSSLECTCIDWKSEEIIRALQTPESSLAEQAGESSEASQPMEVNFTPEVREVTPAGDANARRASDFGQNISIKEYRTNTGQIQQPTKGNSATFNGGAKVRAELPLSASYFEGNRTQDPENTEFEVVKPEIAASYSKRTVVKERAGRPIANWLTQFGVRGELESEYLAQIDKTSYSWNLSPYSVVSDLSGAQPKESEELGTNDSNRSREMATYSSIETSNSSQTSIIPNLPLDSLENTGLGENQNMNQEMIVRFCVTQ